MKKLSVVIPCYNEEKALPLYFEAVTPIVEELKDKVKMEFVLVNDGSKDKTLEVMNDLYEKRGDIMVVNLSRNHGQMAALSAGLKSAEGDYVIMMDSDLQDPVTLIPEIYAKFEEGYEVVSPHRVDRTSDTKFKKDTASLFYRLVNKLEGKEVIPDNVNCFRGLSRRVVDEIVALSEKDRLLLAEIPLVGHKTCMIDFKREERAAGESKYKFKKMVAYALDNISATTTSPLYLPIKIGAICSIITFGLFFIFSVLYFLTLFGLMVGASGFFFFFFILSTIFFATFLIIDFIGLLGIYLHNITINTRNRPTFVIDSVKKPEEK